MKVFVALFLVALVASFFVVCAEIRAKAECREKGGELMRLVGGSVCAKVEKIP